MSAIFGIWDTRGRPLDPAWLAGMQSDLAHRGPDGGGVWTEGSVGLGAQVLKISRSDAFESLPLVSDDFVLVSSARLDDRQALMDRLGLSLEQRKEIPDSQLIALAWRKWGKECPAQLCGDFAFVIWDRKHRQLFGARDHLGIRPFLYYFENGVFIFGSEMRAVVKALPVKPEINESHLLDRVIGINDRPEESPWWKVYRVLPGNAFFISDKGFMSWKYWVPLSMEPIRFKDKRDYSFGLRELMQVAVNERLETDLPLGLMLSGGLDSSSIAVIAAPILKQRNQALYSVSAILGANYRGPAIDEYSYIREVLKKETWIQPVFVESDKVSFGAYMEDYVFRHYVPPNLFYNQDILLFNALRDSGVRRILHGFLGDVTVSNNIVRPIGMYLRQGRPLSALRLLPEYLALYKGRLKDFLASEILRPGLPASWTMWADKVRRHPKHFDPYKWPLALSPIAKEELVQRYESWVRASGMRAPKRVLDVVLPDDPDGGPLEWDVNAGYLNQDIVYPWLDKRLIEYLASLPPEVLRPYGLRRGLIREAMVGTLPDSIRTRSDKTAYMPSYKYCKYNIINELYIDKVIRYNVGKSRLSWINVNRFTSLLKEFEQRRESSIFAMQDWQLACATFAFIFKLTMQRCEKTY